VWGVLYRTPTRAPRGWPAGRIRRALVAILWGALAVGFTAGAIGQYATMHVNMNGAWLAGLLQAAPLLLAARRPLLSWRLMLVGLVIAVPMLATRSAFWPWPVTGWLAMVFVLFQLRLCHDRRTAVGAGTVTALVAIVPAVVIDAMNPLFGIILCLIMAASIGLADLVSGARAAEASLAEQTALRRADLARQAVLEERARIARELHDVVAHHMSVIALQAGAAPYKIEDLSPAARRTFEVILGSAREALAETRRVVGLLREEDQAAERLPQPGLASLDGLVDAAGQAGLRVGSAVVGVPRPVPAGLDLSAYRIVQEALSNAARYAPGSRVQVTIRYATGALVVSVADEGPGLASAPSRGGGHGGGHGLVGMRERAAMLGGRLSAGPRSGGGFEVRAELPYEPAPAGGEPTEGEPTEGEPAGAGR
ncbi:MAG: sensor histidine kinase, partial [Micromonosporaceae bacterium]|nr:sensor histidine kinase [Micromonosporaceae bacterium]